MRIPTLNIRRIFVAMIFVAAKPYLSWQSVVDLKVRSLF
jgi:hypothetical protein